MDTKEELHNQPPIKAPHESFSPEDERLNDFSTRLDHLETDFKVHLAGIPSATIHAVRDEVEREVERWSLTLGTAWKVLGLSALILALVVSLFALKTYNDISKQVTNAVNSQVAQAIGSDKPNSSFNQTLRRAMLDSYFLEVARAQVHMSYPERTVPPPVMSMFLEGLKDPETDDKDFRDIGRALISVARNSRDNQAALAVVGAALAQDDSYSWLKKHPERRSELFDLLARFRITTSSTDLSQRLQNAALVEMSDDENTQLRESALRYLAEQGTIECVPKLSKALGLEKDGELKFEISAALASQDPLDSELLKFIHTRKVQNAKEVAEDLVLLEDIYKGANHNYRRSSPGYIDKENNEKLKQLETELLWSAVNSGRRIGYYYDADIPNGVLGIISSEYESIPEPRLYEFLGDAGRSCIPLLIAQTKDLVKLVKLVKFVSIVFSGGPSKSSNLGQIALTHIDVKPSDQTVIYDGQGVLVEKRNVRDKLILASDAESLYVTYQTQSGHSERVKVGSINVALDDVSFHISDLLERRLAFGIEDF